MTNPTNLIDLNEFKSISELSQIENVDKAAPTQVRMYEFIQEKAIERTKQDIKKWRDALQVAEQVENPDRSALYAIYTDILLDPHLVSIFHSRKQKTLSRAFKIVNDAGEEDLEKTKILEAEWFHKFMNFSLDSRAWGYSLVQFGDIVMDRFSDLRLVPRQHVKPTMGLVVKEPSDEKGINFLEPPMTDWLIGIGDQFDLGFLNSATPFVIWKRNAMGAWAEYQQIFGMPMRVGKTDIQDEKLRVNMENMMKGLGQKSWAVVGLEDTIEFVQSTGSIGNPVYENMAKFCDEQISKLVYGQTMTADNGSSRSQAEVHQEVANEYAASDMKFLQYVINDKLFPLLNIHGFGFDGFQFKWDSTEKLSLKQQFEIDEKLMFHFDVDPAYITEKYGTPVTPKANPIVNPGQPMNRSLAALINRIYPEK